MSALVGQLDMFGGETALPVVEPKAKGKVKVRVDPSLKDGAMVAVQAHVRVSESYVRKHVQGGGEAVQVGTTDFILDDADTLSIPRRRRVSPGGRLVDAGEATMDYLQGQLAASFQATIGDNPRMAQALVVASTLSYRGPIPPLSVAGTGLHAEQKTSAPCLMLQEHHQELQTILGRAGITPFSTPAVLLVALMEMDINDMDVVFAHVVARSAVLAWDRKASEIIRATGRLPMDEWRIEQTYLDTLSMGQVQELAATLELPLPKSAARPRIEKALIEWAADDRNEWFPPQLAELETEA